MVQMIAVADAKMRDEGDVTFFASNPSWQKEEGGEEGEGEALKRSSYVGIGRRGSVVGEGKGRRGG